MLLDYMTWPEDLDRTDYALLGLHGRKANKYAFFPFVRQMSFLHTAWVLPSAPLYSPEAREVRWWFENNAQDAEEIRRSREAIGELIDVQLRQGIAAENIFLIGFSQGAVMCIDTAFRYPTRLGGVISLSGYIVHPQQLLEERHSANNNIPIFLAHGLRDRILSIEVGRENNRILNEMGYNVEYREYDTAHRISSEETRDIRAFLHRHMYGLHPDDPRKRDEHVVAF